MVNTHHCYSVAHVGWLVCEQVSLLLVGMVYVKVVIFI